MVATAKHLNFHAGASKHCVAQMRSPLRRRHGHFPICGGIVQRAANRVNSNRGGKRAFASGKKASRGENIRDLPSHLITTLLCGNLGAAGLFSCAGGIFSQGISFGWLISLRELPDAKHRYIFANWNDPIMQGFFHRIIQHMAI
jgi:hypothetical protein